MEVVVRRRVNQPATTKGGKMDYQDHTFTFDESEDMQFSGTPAAHKSQLHSRQQAYSSTVLSPKEEAVVDAQRMQALTMAAREQTAKIATETKAEIVLHTIAVYGECADQLVEQKDRITNPETKSLYANFAQRIIHKLPDALEQSFDIANAEIDRAGGVNLAALVTEPGYQETEEVSEHIDVTLGDWWRGGKWVTKTVSKKKQR